MAEHRFRITLELASRSFSEGTQRSCASYQLSVNCYSALIKEWADLFVSFAGADSFDPLQVIGAFEWARFDNAFCDGRANSGNVLKFS